MKTILMTIALMAASVASAEKCKYSGKKGACDQEAVSGIEYCNRHYSTAMGDEVRPKQLELNKNADLKGCSRLDKKGKPCTHKAPEGKEICLVHEARDNANAKLKELRKAEKKAKKSAEKKAKAKAKDGAEKAADAEAAK